MSTDRMCPHQDGLLQVALLDARHEEGPDDLGVQVGAEGRHAVELDLCLSTKEVDQLNGNINKTKSPRVQAGAEGRHAVGTGPATHIIQYIRQELRQLSTKAQTSRLPGVQNGAQGGHAIDFGPVMSRATHNMDD